MKLRVLRLACLKTAGGIGAVLRRAGLGIAFIGAIALVSLAFTLPLWWWATRDRYSYTVCILLFSGGFLLWMVGLKIARLAKELGGIGVLLVGRLLPACGRVLKAGVVLLLLAAEAALLARRQVVAAILLGAFILVLAGYLHHSRQGMDQERDARF